MITVLDLANEDTKFNDKVSTRKEKKGPCPDPNCGKRTDGFSVKWDGERWVFMCRGCWDSTEYLPDKDRKRGWGDEFAYVRHFRKMGYGQAIAFLHDAGNYERDEAIKMVLYVPDMTEDKAEDYLDYHLDLLREERGDNKVVSSRRKHNARPRRSGYTPKQYDYTSLKWQETIGQCVQEYETRLWTPDGAAALEILHNRGLRDEVIKGAHTGFTDKDGVPRLTFPVYNNGRYVAVYRRDLRPDCPHGERWKDAAGSTKNELYLADCLKVKRPTVMVESAPDALSLIQECGNMVNVVATGSVTGVRDNIHALATLARMPLVLLAFDADKEGDDCREWWFRRLPNAHKLRPILHDVNDMLVDNWDIRAWVGQAIHQHQVEQAEPTEEELFRALPPDEQQAYLAAMAEPIPCSQCLDEGIVTPLDPDQEVCPRHAPSAAHLSPDEITQRIIAISGLDLVLKEVFPITEEAAVKARVEQEYREQQSHRRQPSARAAFDSKKQPRWEDHGFVKDPQGNWREERRYRKELQESINQAIKKNKQVSVDNVPAPEQLV